MDFEIGVLLFHCTPYGKADFDIQCSIEALFNALSNRLDKEEMRKGFEQEAYSCLENEEEFLKSSIEDEEEIEEIDPEAVTKLFEETYKDFAS